MMARLTCAVVLLLIAACPVAWAQAPGYDDLAVTAPGAARTAATRPAVEAPQFEMWFELKVRLRSLMADADMFAGGRLLMEGRADGKGQLELSLLKPLVHPYKFYWMKAIGKQETKSGNEVTLEAGTWDARKKAEDDALANAQKQYQAWKQQWGGKRDFDGSFNFLVLGDPRGRFNTACPSNGALGGVTNRLTHRWIPDGFVKWTQGKAEEGYSFWAADKEPPDWEPHCYHAFAVALKLLGSSVFAGDSPDKTAALGRNAQYDRQIWGVPERVRDVMETLVPKAKGQIDGWGNPTLKCTVAVVDDRQLAVLGTSGVLKVDKGGGLQYTVNRQLRYDREAKAVTQNLSKVRVWKDGGPEMALEVGYQPKR